MTELHAEPDFEEAVIGYLTRDGSSLLDLVEKDHVGTKLHRRQATELAPAFRIFRIGGLPTESSAQHLIRARFQAEAYAYSTPAAYAIAAAADLELRRIFGRWGNVIFTGADRKELGIQWSDDPDSNAERYVFGPVLLGHAVPGD